MLAIEAKFTNECSKYTGSLSRKSLLFLLTGSPGVLDGSLHRRYMGNRSEIFEGLGPDPKPDGNSSRQGFDA